MAKRLLVCSLLILYFLSLQATEEGMEEKVKALPKSAVKKLIIKNPINEEIIYLTKLLSLSRDEVKNEFMETLSEHSDYKAQLQEPTTFNNIHLKEFNLIKNKINNFNTQLRVFRKRFGEETKPYTNLLLRLEIENNTLKQYKILLKNEINEIIENKNDTLKRMSLILQALYLNSTSSEDFKENKHWYRLLSKKFHPDKIKNVTEEIKKENTDFFSIFEPLLQSNKKNNSLKNMILSIYDKKNEKMQTRSDLIGQINNTRNNSSLFLNFNCGQTLPMIGEGLGAALGNKLFASLKFITSEENICR